MQQETQDEIDSRYDQRCSIADAKLLVAERLGWHVMLGWGAYAQLRWDSWLITIPICAGIYFLTTYDYQKDHERAWDAYGNRPILKD